MLKRPGGVQHVTLEMENYRDNIRAGARNNSSLIPPEQLLIRVDRRVERAGVETVLIPVRCRATRVLVRHAPRWVLSSDVSVAKTLLNGDVLILITRWVHGLVKRSVMKSCLVTSTPANGGVILVFAAPALCLNKRVVIAAKKSSRLLVVLRKSRKLASTALMRQSLAVGSVQTGVSATLTVRSTSVNEAVMSKPVRSHNDVPWLRSLLLHVTVARRRLIRFCLLHDLHVVILSPLVARLACKVFHADINANLNVTKVLVQNAPLKWTYVVNVVRLQSRQRVKICNWDCNRVANVSVGPP